MQINQGALASEPFTTADAKAFLRVSTTSEGALIDAYVASARQSVEQYLGRALINRTVTYSLDASEIGNEIYLPFAPMVSLTTVKVYDTAAQATTMTSGPTGHYVLHGSDPAKIVPGDLGFLGSVDVRTVNAMEITYVAGYGPTAASIAPAIMQGLRILVGEYYTARQESIVGQQVNELPQTARSILAPFRIGHLTQWI